MNKEGLLKHFFTFFSIVMLCLTLELKIKGESTIINLISSQKGKAVRQSAFTAV